MSRVSEVPLEFGDVEIDRSELPSELMHFRRELDLLGFDWNKLRVTLVAADGAENEHVAAVEAELRKAGVMSIARAEKATSPDPRRNLHLDGLLQVRLVKLLAHIAIRKHLEAETQQKAKAVPTPKPNSRPTQPAWSMRIVDRCIKRVQGPQTSSSVWRKVTAQLLLAMEREKELMPLIERWSRSAAASRGERTRWRLLQGYLLAQKDKLADAVRQLEQLGADELGLDNWLALSDWYLALGREAEFQQSAEDMFGWVTQWEIEAWINHINARTDTDTAQLKSQVVDANLLRAHRGQLLRSSDTEYPLSQLLALYQSTKDFRVLAVVPDALAVTTAKHGYSMLDELQYWSIEVLEEAAVDELSKAVMAARRRAASDVNRRMLDLLVGKFACGMSTIEDNPGEHINRCRAALERVFASKIPDEEVFVLARVLNAYPKGSSDLQERILASLVELSARLKSESPNHMQVVEWIVTREYETDSGEALARLEAVLTAHRELHGGYRRVVVRLAQLYGRWLKERGHYKRCEAFLIDAAKTSTTYIDRLERQRELDRFYLFAMKYRTKSGERIATSLGVASNLYRALGQQVLKDLDVHRANKEQTEADREIVSNIDRLCDIFETAHQSEIDGEELDLRNFVADILPDLLDRIPPAWRRNAVGRVAQTLTQLTTTRETLAFLVKELEAEAKRGSVPGRELWPHVRSRIATLCRLMEARQKSAKATKPDEDAQLLQRLLAVVLDQLRSQLRRGTRNAQAGPLLSRHRGDFWKEHEQDFRRVAQDVLANHADEPKVVDAVAYFFHQHLNDPTAAIKVFQAADKRSALGAESLRRLITAGNSVGSETFDAVPYLRRLIELEPNELAHRISLLRWLGMTKRFDEFPAEVRAARLSRQKLNQWQWNEVIDVADALLNAKQYQAALDLYEEAMTNAAPTHFVISGTKRWDQFSQFKVINGAQLRHFYSQQAYAYAGLKRFDDATSKALAAIGIAEREELADAIDAFEFVVSERTDLDAYAKQIDRQAKSTQMDSAIIRKAVGTAYMNRDEPAKAIPHLAIAVQLEPTDENAREELISAHDRIGQQNQVVDQSISLALHSREGHWRYEDVLNQMRSAKVPAEQQLRFETSAVELSHGESSGYAWLAERREVKQPREAIQLWLRADHEKPLDPNALINAARLQIDVGDKTAARDSIRKLESRDWDQAGRDLVQSEITELRSLLQD